MTVLTKVKQGGLRERDICKHGGTVVMEERAGGGCGRRESDCTVNGAVGLKTKADSDLDLLCVT